MAGKNEALARQLSEEPARTKPGMNLCDGLATLTQRIPEQPEGRWFKSISAY